MDDFAAFATVVLRRAGLEAAPEDLALVELVYEGLAATVAALDGVAPAEAPFSALDIGHAP
jgi:hypothetical protein